ncbi:MAG: DUF1428 domain-containing protein [Paraglaciecola sp.]|nr:DUF1428 domain-containing protein [Paraglaciecola sp.]NCT47238.1 DUF1428 domain-containing protein [Paraglaciecola sp.]
MKYVDGFVLAVPTANREIYQKFALDVAELFREMGALKVVECWGSEVPEGKVTSFPMAVKCQPEETVVFSWIEWPSKSVRDQAMPRILQDPRFDMSKNPIPFDGKRMIFGSFEMFVEV